MIPNKFGSSVVYGYIKINLAFSFDIIIFRALEQHCMALGYVSLLKKFFKKYVLFK